MLLRQAIDREIGNAAAETNEALRARDSPEKRRQVEALVEKQSTLDTARSEQVKEVKAIGDTLLRELEGTEARASALRRSTSRGGHLPGTLQAAESIATALAQVPESVGKAYSDAATLWRQNHLAGL